MTEPRTQHMTRGWRRHPGVRSGDELTLGERAADRMRNAMGSWPFVLLFIAGMGMWVVLNTLVIQHLLTRKPFDPYPYILLNLFLSMLAGLQAAILLIAAKRSDQIASELAQHDYKVNQNALGCVERLESLIREIHDHTVPPVDRPRSGA